MFTGIIEEVGTISFPGARMRIACHKVLEDTIQGSSIAVNGTCLTAVRVEPDGFWMDLSPETLGRTNLGALTVGSLVNLERAVSVGDRLGGHIVQGHVDGTGELLDLDALPDGSWWLRIGVPSQLERYMILKGPVAIDGVSLTIAALEREVLSVAIIPHTYENTALRAAKPGDPVNLEADMIAKYVEKLMAASAVR